MSTQVHTDHENYTIEIDDAIGTIVFTWDQFVTGQEFRDGANDLLEVIRREDKHKLIVDTSGIKAHDDADKEWLQEEWIPKTIEAGIEYSVSVPGESVISEMEMEEFVDQAQDLPYTYVLVGDMQEAREWIAEQ
jgi:hypothetical protein